MEIRAPFNPTSAVEQMAATLKEYGLSSTTGDRYGAGWIPDAFSKVDVSYTHSEVDRSEAYLNVLPKFMAGKVRLLDNARLISQFASLERRRRQAGAIGSIMARTARTIAQRRRRWCCRHERAAF